MNKIKIFEQILNEQEVKNKKTPKIAKMFAGIMDFAPGPFTIRELSAAYGQELDATSLKSINKIYPYFRYVGQINRRNIYIFKPTKDFYDKLEKWQKCSDFEEEKRAAKERLEKFRDENFDSRVDFLVQAEIEDRVRAKWAELGIDIDE